MGQGTGMGDLDKFLIGVSPQNLAMSRALMQLSQKIILVGPKRAQ